MPQTVQSAHTFLPELPRTILVADDEHLAAASLVFALRQLGYEVVGPARDGEHAVELAFSSRPDLALLDVRMMHSTDGIDAACVFLRELGIPVITVSAYSDSRQVSHASQAGIFGYLVKPVTKEQLRPAISVAWSLFLKSVATQTEAGELRTRLENRQLIDQAKWMLVERMEIDEGAAMRLMRIRAKEQGKSLGRVARDIVGPIALL